MYGSWVALENSNGKFLCLHRRGPKFQGKYPSDAPQPPWGTDPVSDAWLWWCLRLIDGLLFVISHRASMRRGVPLICRIPCPTRRCGSACSASGMRIGLQTQAE